MTLHQIATDMNTTQEELRSYAKGGELPETIRLHANLRTFIRRAFTEGFGLPQIMAYVDRSEIMVTHALRMVCVDEYGLDYGQSVDGMAQVMRAA